MIHEIRKCPNLMQKLFDKNDKYITIESYHYNGYVLLQQAQKVIRSSIFAFLIEKFHTT